MEPELGKWYQADTRYLFRADKIGDRITQGIQVIFDPDKIIIDDMDLYNHLFGTRALMDAHHLFMRTILMGILEEQYEIEFRNRKWNLVNSK